MNQPEPVTLLPAWDKIKPTLDSGDVLLFAGESRFARGIKRLTRCHWSHSAFVARVRDRLLLFEAALDRDLADIVTPITDQLVVRHESMPVTSIVRISRRKSDR